MINIQEIEKSFREDISQRGENLLVYDYFGRVTKLKNVDIYYDTYMGNIDLQKSLNILVKKKLYYFLKFPKI